MIIHNFTAVLRQLDVVTRPPEKPFEDQRAVATVAARLTVDVVPGHDRERLVEEWKVHPD